LAVIITKILIGGILKLINEKSNFTLLDVREDSELKIAKIKISKHIPMGEILTRIDEIDIETPVIVMCHSGVRSARVCQYLTENGYDASNLTGGINSWSTDVDPSIPIY
jgi:rhodanese-related sulfurtransferase